MSKPETTTALAMLTSPELKANQLELAQLQQSVIAQFARLHAMRREETIRGLLLGMSLHRIKASLPYGDFGPWMKQHVEGYSERWARYLMRLALVFIERTRPSKPMMLALPGDQTELALESMVGAQRAFMEKAQKFCGELSLSELLDKHGIKETGKLGGARTKAGNGAPVIELTSEQLYLHARDEIGSLLDRIEGALLRDNLLQHLAGHPEEIRGVVDGLAKLTAKVEAATRPMLRGAAAPNAQR